MSCEPLNLNHKELLSQPLKNIDTMISEYNFANLYLFRKKHRYKVCKFNHNNKNYIFIKGVTYDNKTYLMPILEPVNLETKILDKIKNEADFLYPIDEKWLPSFKNYNVEYNDNDSDYIYTTEKISTYKGRKLHKKRNLLKQFKKLYDYQVEPLTHKRIKDALLILERWLNENELDASDTDYYECLEALEMNEELALCGLIYYVENTPAGFITGEEHNDELFLIHFAKGLKNFKGIYQFIYNDFAKKLPKKYKYLNFEQDLGKMALRKAKQSYIPDILLKKYRVILH